MAGAKRTQREPGLIGKVKIQPTTEKAGVELTVREAGLAPKLRDWRAKLSAKAKQEKGYRFYSLYGLVSHPETLLAAWVQVRANATSRGPRRFQDLPGRGVFRPSQLLARGMVVRVLWRATFPCR